VIISVVYRTTSKSIHWLAKTCFSLASIDLDQVHGDTEDRFL